MAIGNFDGVHLGHRAVIAAASGLAEMQGSELAVLTFEPHPREVLMPDRAPARLTPMRRKIELMRSLGVRRLVVLRFDRTLMTMPPERFIDEVLRQRLRARAVATGAGFRFGHKRQGDAAMLDAAASAGAFRYAPVENLLIGGEPCSSTRVRAALAGGDLELARQLLGYDYTVVGIVRHGDRRGREIGFPTANVYPLPTRACLPANGIYVVRAGVRPAPGEGGATRWHPAVASLGFNPTFDGRERRLEVHLLEGRDHELYGRRLEVAFLHKLRDEARFADVDALVRQMHADCARARAMHGMEAADGDEVAGGRAGARPSPRSVYSGRDEDE